MLNIHTQQRQWDNDIETDMYTVRKGVGIGGRYKDGGEGGHRGTRRKC